MSSNGAVLVTGGAGYIGSHVVRQLGERDEQIVVVDSLDTGFRDAVLAGQFYQGKAGDIELISRLVREHDVRAVMHFAAKTIVPESVSNPLLYYQNNTMETRNLLQACADNGIEQFVFSSTAAVYGMPPDGIASEQSPTSPINPYGTSKLMSEWMIRDLAAASSFRPVVLRYFNVAGSDPQGRVGQRTPKATLLIKVLAELATGKRKEFKLYGTDYDTPDGTCIRDYIHVEDLASAHLAALDYLRSDGTAVTLNCGYGQGYSVRQVIDVMEAELGHALDIETTERRPGDPPELIAEAKKIQQLLAWQPRFNDLKSIVKSSLDWEHKQL